jgi:predicted nucleic acid-binding protein
VKSSSVIVAEPPAAYRARSPLVVDSSIVCAVLFDETERAQALERIEGRSLFAPHLLDHEVVHVALKKQRGGWPADSLGLALADYAAYQIEMVDTDIGEQYALAQRYGLSGHDAAYLWLAARLKAPLATFDRELGDAARRHFDTL